MTVNLDALHAQVLSLSKAERARLLDRLVASLDADSEADAAWEQLAAEREAALASGAVGGISIVTAMEQLRARFPE
jgi:hypothetical protein